VTADEGESARPEEVGTPAPTTYFDLQRPRSSKPLRELPTLLAEALGFVWRSSPKFASLMVAVSVVQGLLTIGLLAVGARIVSGMQQLESAGDVADLAPELLAFTTVFVLQGVAQQAANEIRLVIGERTAARAQRLVAGAASRAPLIQFERPTFHDRLQRSLANSSTRPLQVAYSSTTIVSSAVLSLALIVTLAIFQPLVLVIILVGAIPLWISTRLMTRIGFEFTLNETEDDRRRSYLLHLLTSKAAAQEIRAFQLAEHLADRHTDLWRARIARVGAFARRRFKLGIISRIVNGVVVGAVIGVLAWTIADGQNGLAAATVTGAAVFLLGQRMSALLGGVGTLYECALFLADVDTFTASFPELVADDEGPHSLGLPRAGKLVASGLSFEYPTSERLVLDHVSVEVASGEMIALVGANGSGKTTLVKLLAGLLPASEGTVSWGGEAIDSGDPNWHAHVAIVFQDYLRFLLTLGENVAFGRVEASDDEQAIRRSLDEAGLGGLVDSLRLGTGSLLGPEFLGGTDLSGGQWQRVALARAFFRDASIVILDEPSSALDPDAEAALFETVRNLCVGRAVVVISHRFSTVTHADRIYVMANGRIVESGSHSELMRANGEYARMYRLQASRYSTSE
jgi:ATP-binding cassette, subfamily B, bacterial